MTTLFELDKDTYNNMKDKLFNYFEDETLERVMEGLNEFALKYVETNDCPFLINDIFVNKVDELIQTMEKSDYLGEMISTGHILPEELGYMKPHSKHLTNVVACSSAARVCFCVTSQLLCLHFLHENILEPLFFF